MTNITIKIPSLLTNVTQSLYNLEENGEIKGMSFGDSANSRLTFDDSFNTIYSSANSTCWVGYNFGANTYADVSEIKFVPNPKWAVAATKL
jgi:hypothetical protein